MDRVPWGVVGILMLGVGLVLFLTETRRLPEGPLAPYKPNLANGEKMFDASGCASCHAAPISAEKCDDHKGGKRTELAGGRCFKTAYGTFYAPNISSDKNDGIGAWNETDFVTAIRRGVSPGGDHYYPAFPYASYQRMRLEDVRDLKAFMDTLPAVRSKTPKHDLSFPYSIRWLLGIWKYRYLDGEPFKPNPHRAAEHNRGAYLVEGPGHCGECHTPRDPLGGMIQERALSGAPAPEGKGWIPNITPHENGLANWSLGDIAYALKSGFTPEFDTMGGSMTKVQENLARLSDADRKAIAVYLKSLRPIASAKPKKKPSAP